MEHVSPVGSLSDRETEVLELAARGLPNHRIAAGLDLSVHAVKFHLASVYRKLNVANRTEAAVVYLEASGRRAAPSRRERALLEEAT
jgi:DNA-binding NarL/FixJ family response regulator